MHGLKRRIASIGWTLALGAGLCLTGAAHATGTATYLSRCSMCHQPSGAGLPGQFPRLSGRVAQIAASPAGRALLGKIMLYGMYGSIKVDGKMISGLMPPMGSLADQDVADVLNYVVAFKKGGKPVGPFTAAEVAKLRTVKMSGAAVGAERNDLATKGLVP